MIKQLIEKIQEVTTLADSKLVRKRKSICRKCLVKVETVIGWTCGTLLNESNEPGKETCGCALEAKWRLLNFHCTQKKW